MVSEISDVSTEYSKSDNNTYVRDNLVLIQVVSRVICLSRIDMLSSYDVIV